MAVWKLVNEEGFLKKNAANEFFYVNHYCSKNDIKQSEK